MKKHDILCPSITPGYYQHLGKPPNTKHQEKLYEYRLRREDYLIKREQEEAKCGFKNKVDIRYEEHSKRRHLQRLIKDKVEEKLKKYEESIEERRDKLKELFYKEEREHYRETVDLAQKYKSTEFEEMKIRAQTLKKKREEERQKVVHQKRIEQYSNRCQELRPILFKKNLVESKYAQLQQMKENEARRETEREIDRMYHELSMKEMKIMMERDEQEAIKRDMVKKDMMNVWDMQIKGKELLKAEMEKIAEEDRIEMQRLSEEIRREEIAALDNKRKKRDANVKEILDQIAMQEELKKKRKLEEKTLDEAYSTLARLEDQREKQAYESMTEQFKKETEMYRQSLRELEEERKKEEKELEELLEIHRKEVEKKQDEAKCKLWEAKRKLHQSVMEGRAEQIAYKRQEAEEQLKLKQAENELLKMRFEQNERLQAESDRLETEAIRQYRDDLQKQIEYNNVLRERERQELERQLQQGLEEEKKYQKIVQDMLNQTGDVNLKHPFRRVLERVECHCPATQ